MDANIFRIVAAAILVTIFAVFIKGTKGTFPSPILTIAGSILIFFMVVPPLLQVFEVFNTLASHVDSSLDFVPIILRILGVAYIAEFGASICKDADEKTLAANVELGGKAIIMVMAAPIILSFLNTVIGILP